MAWATWQSLSKWKTKSFIFLKHSQGAYEHGHGHTCMGIWLHGCMGLVSFYTLIHIHGRNGLGRHMSKLIPYTSKEYRCCGRLWPNKQKKWWSPILVKMGWSHQFGKVQHDKSTLILHPQVGLQIGFSNQTQPNPTYTSINVFCVCIGWSLIV